MALEPLEGPVCWHIDCIVELGAIKIFLDVVILIDDMGKDFRMVAFGKEFINGFGRFFMRRVVRVVRVMWGTMTWVIKVIDIEF